MKKRFSCHTDINGVGIYEGDLLKMPYRAITVFDFLEDSKIKPATTRFEDGFTVDEVLFTNEIGWHVVSVIDGKVVPLAQFAFESEVTTKFERGLHITSNETKNGAHVSVMNMVLHPRTWAGI